MTDFKKVFIDMSPLIYYHDNTEIIENFDRFLEYMNIKVIPIGTLIAKQGAKVRAKYKDYEQTGKNGLL